MKTNNQEWIDEFEETPALRASDSTEPTRLRCEAEEWLRQIKAAPDGAAYWKAKRARLVKRRGEAAVKYLTDEMQRLR